MAILYTWTDAKNGVRCAVIEKASDMALPEARDMAVFFDASGSDAYLGTDAYLVRELLRLVADRGTPVSATPNGHWSEY